MMLALVGDNTVVEITVKDGEVLMCLNGDPEAYAFSMQEADALADIIKKLVYTQ